MQKPPFLQNSNNAILRIDPIPLQVRFIRGERQSYEQIIRLHQRNPLVKEFSSSERVNLSDQFYYFLNTFRKIR